MRSRGFNSTDEFLGHKQSQFGDSKFLKDWKEAGYVDVWLHQLSRPASIWRHQFPYVNVYTNRDTQEVSRQVWTRRMVCLEPEEILQHQNEREGDERVYPPEHCPQCRVAEQLRFLVKRRKVDMTEVLWRMVGDDPEKARVLYAGAAANLFNDKMSPEDKSKLRAKSIFIKKTFGQSLFAKLEYVVQVCTEIEPSKGLQIAFIGSGLGDKVKLMIHGTRKSLGPEDGDPFKVPYCVRWEYNKAADKPNDMYSATRMERILLTPAVKKAINGPPVDLKRVYEPYKVDVLRADLERFYVGPKGLLNLDEAFDVKAPEVESDEEDANDEFPPSDAGESLEVRGHEAPAPPADDEMVACDTCEKEIKLSDPKCPHCGHVYVAEPAPPPPPATPPLRSRAEVAAAKAAAAKVSPAPANKPSPAKVEDDTTDDFDFG